MAGLDAWPLLHHQSVMPGAVTCVGQDMSAVRTTFHKPDISLSLDVSFPCASGCDLATLPRRENTYSRNSSETVGQSYDCECGSADWRAVRMPWSSPGAGIYKACLPCAFSYAAAHDSAE